MKSSFFLILPLLSLFGGVTGSSSFQAGTATRTPVHLTETNFKQAIQDPANSFWLLKFYAPWCGHCKKMAPTLEKVAGPLSGKMSIGKIDCTVDENKSLCREYGIRGYPTLKFSLDGQVYDYPGGRDEDAILKFAGKMTRPTVSSVSTPEEAMRVTSSEGEGGLSFVVFHSDVASVEGSANVEDKLQASLLTQVFAQVARKEKAFGSFLLLETDASSNPGKLFGTTPEGPFLCRLEDNVAPRCFDGANSATLDSMHEWVKAQNIPTVTKLGPHNFNKVGRSGRPLVIGVVTSASDLDQMTTMKRTLADFAANGPMELREKYYYGLFDGKKWAKFLEQFDLSSEELPQIFVLDVPTKKYWQDSSFKLDVGRFLKAIEDGTIQSKVGSKRGLEGMLKRFIIMIIDNSPWSVAALVIVLVFLFAGIASFLSPGQELRPPYNNNTQTVSSPANDAAATKDENAPVGEEEKDSESKKDK